MDSIQRQVRVFETLDVEAVERALADLWKETAAESVSQEALLRARAANVMVFLADRSILSETHQTIGELAALHPCRALVLAGEYNADDRDIEISISAFCPTGKRSESSQLCCEEITLTAEGEFVAELPSAVIPLLLPDLQIFLWWRDNLRTDDKVFKALLSAVDRLILDSADFRDPLADLGALTRILASAKDDETRVSDINWERLTPWRASLANFYDVPSYRAALDNVEVARIDYVVREENSEQSFYSPSAQPLLITGWLASRLDWQLSKPLSEHQPATRTLFQFSKDDRAVNVELNPWPIHTVKAGRIMRIELESSGNRPATFVVSRSEDGQYLETTANMGSQSCPARRVRFQNRSTAELLSREMEILCVDQVYEEAIRLTDLLL